MSNTITASVVQACTVKYDLDQTLQKMTHYVQLAKNRDDAQLVVFPEAFIGGYPKGLTFGAPIGFREQSGRDDYFLYHQSAIPIPGPATARIEGIARDNDVMIVTGVVEREEGGGSLWCSVIWVCPERGVIGKRRKLMPTAGEKLIWSQGTSQDITLTTTPLPSHPTPVKISATICWENYMPLLRTHLYVQGVQVYCAPTVDGREQWGSTMRHVALEGRCFVLSANQFSRRKDHVPSTSTAPISSDGRSTTETLDEEEIMIAGGSMIVDPLGNILAGPLRESEGILTAQLDLDMIVKSKFDLDVTGHYSRPDLFELRVHA